MAHDPPSDQDRGARSPPVPAAALFERVLNAVGNPVFIKDEQFRFVFVNEAMCTFMGMARERIIGRTDYDLVPTLQADGFRAQDQAVLTTREPTMCEEFVRTAHGDERLVLTHKAVFEDERGRLMLVVSIEDITHRARNESRTRLAHDFMERLIDALPVQMFVRDRERRFTAVNAAYCEFMGFTREQLLGEHFHTVYPDRETRELVQARDDEVFASRGSSTHEVVLADAQGRPHSVITKRTVLLNDNDEEVMLVVFSDVTDLKYAEENVRIAAQVYEHSGEGIVVADTGLRVLSVNAAFFRITGFAAADVMGQDATTLLDGSQLGDTLGEAVRRALREYGRWQGEVVGRRRSGELYPAWATLSVVRDDAGAVQRYIAIFTDISERRAGEERVRWLAQHDVLTNLANRNLLTERIESALRRARRYGQRVALLLIDLDDFKEVNDRLGHRAGDAVLTEVGRRMSALVRDTDTVARLGGDEFAILLPDQKAGTDAERVAASVVQAMARPFELEDDNEVAHIGASIGIAMHPEHGADIESLLHAADEAMYQVKAAGRGGIAYHGQPVRRIAAGD
jgi:diguanylate cyclase (GGDEF)-like protein/PAS domain S-box-containing protein